MGKLTRKRPRRELYMVYHMAFSAYRGELYR